MHWVNSAAGNDEPPESPKDEGCLGGCLFSVACTVTLVLGFVGWMYAGAPGHSLPDAGAVPLDAGTDSGHRRHRHQRHVEHTTEAPAPVDPRPAPEEVPTK